ncbi:unnamed protein product [Amoebophrya sp. A25]|nr:unnamed protein product [Amoebophrya sp. A25]|eukprot:GSA25T00017349001.1
MLSSTSPVAIAFSSCTESVPHTARAWSWTSVAGNTNCNKWSSYLVSSFMVQPTMHPPTDDFEGDRIRHNLEKSFIKDPEPEGSGADPKEKQGGDCHCKVGVHNYSQPCPRHFEHTPPGRVCKPTAKYEGPCPNSETYDFSKFNAMMLAKWEAKCKALFL